MYFLIRPIFKELFKELVDTYNSFSGPVFLSTRLR